MLARFENGWFLEVVINIEEDEPEASTYDFAIYDEDREYVNGDYTEYRMYYPLDEIGYILYHCNTPELENLNKEYTILKQNTMIEYIDYLCDLKYGEKDGDWILERQGTDYDDIRYYLTEEDAKAAMIMEVEESDVPECYWSVFENYCIVSDSEYFQSWEVYKKKEFTTEKDRLFNEIEREIERTYTGIDQYAYELTSTWVAKNHLEKLEELITELKEMI